MTPATALPFVAVASALKDTVATARLCVAADP